MHSESPVISAEGLSKRLGSVDAVAGLDFTVPAGSVCGFLGRNGAGKTTTIKMLMGMTRPDSGQARIFGEPIDDQIASVRIRRGTGFVPEVKEFYPLLTVRQMIDFTRAFYPQWRNDWEERCLRDYELPVEQKTGKLSKGMRSKLALLLAFSRGAQLLILDEPTDGLDPVAIEALLQHVVALAGEGQTIFFSSHQLHEVEQICDRVCLIDHGKAVLETDLDEAKTRFRRVSITFPDSVPGRLFEGASVGRLKVRGRSVSLLVNGDGETLAAQARQAGATNVEFTPVSLKEIFLETVGEER
ncbi:MAG: ABC transporter ATP-binding protein [Candidatus Acidiferrales bacterium]